jgi:hypothetical protein
MRCRCGDTRRRLQIATRRARSCCYWTVHLHGRSSGGGNSKIGGPTTERRLATPVCLRDFCTFARLAVLIVEVFDLLSWIAGVSRQLALVSVAGYIRFTSHTCT